MIPLLYFPVLVTRLCPTFWAICIRRGVDSHALLQGNLSDPGIEPTALGSPALAGRFFFFFLPLAPPGKPPPPL